MKALVLEDIGKIEYKEVPTPKPGKGEVLLKIRNCGICSSDKDRIFKNGTYHFPTIPGHEFSGEIVELGQGVNPELIGRKAGVYPLLPCRQCAPCRSERYAQSVFASSRTQRTPSTSITAGGRSRGNSNMQNVVMRPATGAVWW